MGLNGATRFRRHQGGAEGGKPKARRDAQRPVGGLAKPVRRLVRGGQAKRGRGGRSLPREASGARRPKAVDVRD